MTTPQMEKFLDRFAVSLKLVKPIPMQDFVQISENFNSVLIAISINCIKTNRFQVRLHLVGDILLVGTEIKDIGALSYYGTKEEVTVWVKYNLPIFINLIDSMRRVDSSNLT